MDNETYTAWWSPEDLDITLVVDRYAGRCGPEGTEPAATREDGLAILALRGYRPNGEWRITSGGDHCMDLIYIGLMPNLARIFAK